MPNEFKVKNGLIVDAGGTTITGSFTASGSSHTIIGTLNATSSQAVSASFALTASFALNAGTTVSTASLLTTASATSNVITFTKGDASTFTVTVATGSGGTAFPYTGSANITGSLNVVGPLTITASTYAASVRFAGLDATNQAFDLVYPTNGALRFGVSGGDGPQFQGWGGTEPNFPGQMYFDYGSFTRNVANRAAYWRSMTTGATTTVMTLNASGNLGLGKTPTARLDVTGSVSITGSTAIQDPSSQVPFQVSSGSTPLVYVSSSGNIGINTSTPNTPLHVSTTTTSTNTTVNTFKTNLSSTGTTAASFTNGMLLNSKVITQDDTTLVAIKAGLRFATSLPTSWGSQFAITTINNGTTTDTLFMSGNGGNEFKIRDNTSADIFQVNNTVTNAISQIRCGTSTTSAFLYRTTNGGSNLTPTLVADTNGTISLVLHPTNGLVFTNKNASSINIASAAIQLQSISTTAGAEAGDLLFYTQTGGAAITERMRILNDSRILLTSAFTSTNTTSQSYFQITGSIQQVQTASAQIYAVNITPTMVFTTGSQTQTTLRIAPTFSGSAAFTSSQSNIVADFGAVGAGTQFSVNDITSGSIYMVNDVSGLPIIEALSDWTVNMYNYPTKVFQKTGSSIIISGSLNVSGSVNITTGSITITSGSVTMPNRPAFRVYGASTTGIPQTTTISGSATTVDYNQGNNYNNTTGIFTAPIAGLYSVYLNARTQNTNQSQIIIYKNRVAGVGGTIMMMWETTGSLASHFGVSSILNLATNDTLQAVVAVGTIQFDSNDNWGAAYIG